MSKVRLVRDLKYISNDLVKGVELEVVSVTDVKKETLELLQRTSSIRDVVFYRYKGRVSFLADGDYEWVKD